MADDDADASEELPECDGPCDGRVASSGIPLGPLTLCHRCWCKLGGHDA